MIRGTADPSASLGMTKGRATLLCASVGWWREQQVPPLRFAPVGMTIHILVKIVFPKKVTSSQDDDFLEGSTKKHPN
jgi:hypothetical protein